MILDGWSQQILLRDLFAAYRGQPLPPVRNELFREHIYSLREKNEGESAAFWRREFAGYRAPSRQLKTEAASRHAVLVRRVPHTVGLSGELRRRAVTWSVLYQTAWALALIHLYEQTDVVFGVASSGRASGTEGIEDAVGLFMNTLPFRCRAEGDGPIDSVLNLVQDIQARLVAHEGCGLLSIQNWIGWDRRWPLIECLYVYERFPLDLGPLEQAENLEIRDIRATTHEHYPLVLVVEEEQESMKLSLKYAGIPESAGCRWEDLLAFIASIPERLISTPDLCLAELMKTLP